MNPAREREGCGGAHDQNVHPTRGSVAPHPGIPADRGTHAPPKRHDKPRTRQDAGCGGTGRPACCMLPARGVSGLLPGRKRAVELRVRRCATAPIQLSAKGEK